MSFRQKGATNEEYEGAMAEALSEYRDLGINVVVFGDLFLEDVRAYREQFLARLGMRGLYPVWMRDTGEFVRQFIALGFKAVVTCVSAGALDCSFAGRMIDEEFLALLPAGRRPLRRAWRVPHVRLRRAFVQRGGEVLGRREGAQ